MGLETWILIIILGFAFGYWLGHRHGHDEGYRLGVVFAPIELRRRTLEVGRCSICGAGVNPGVEGNHYNRGGNPG